MNKLMEMSYRKVVVDTCRNVVMAVSFIGTECHFCHHLPLSPLSLANVLTPFSIPKCPETQTFPTFVPTIAFQGSNRGDWKLSKNLSKEIIFGQVWTIFLTDSSPHNWSPEKQSSGQILEKFRVLAMPQNWA